MRAPGMQVLTDQIKAKRPGVVIYGIGDDAHKLRVSGHNEDDTVGVRAEDQDDDTIPEHRAIDVMLGSAFTRIDGHSLVSDLVSHEENRRRMLYINYENTQWSRSTGWTPHDNSDDPHPGHVHISGEADADANTTPWILSEWDSAPASGSDLLLIDGMLGPKTISRWQQVMGTKIDGVISVPYSQLVAAVQTKLKATVDSTLNVDGYGILQNNKRYKTAGALQRYLKVPVDEVISAPVSQTIKALQRRLNEGRF